MDGNADNYRELGEIYDRFEHRFNSQDGSKNMHVEHKLYLVANILLRYGSWTKSPCKTGLFSSMYN